MRKSSNLRNLHTVGVFFYLSDSIKNNRAIWHVFVLSKYKPLFSNTFLYYFTLFFNTVIIIKVNGNAKEKPTVKKLMVLYILAFSKAFMKAIYNKNKEGKCCNSQIS